MPMGLTGGNAFRRESNVAAAEEAPQVGFSGLPGRSTGRMRGSRFLKFLSCRFALSQS